MKKLQKTEESWRNSKELEEFFPNVDIPLEPVGDLILFQIKMARKKFGSIIMIDESKDFDKWNTMIAKVVKVGPVAFKDPDNLKEWPEGKWAKVGSYVVIPKYGSVKFAKTIPGEQEKCLFAILRCKDIRAIITGNPLEVEEYV
jgi:hypothetical protein